MPRQPAQTAEILLKELVTRREQLVEMRAAEYNRVGLVAPLRQGEIHEHIAWLSAHITALQEEIQAVLERSPEQQAQVQRLETIPGVGLITAATIVADMPELGQLNRQQIAALAGLAPFNRDSGQKRGKRRIFGGRKGVRRVLYMACMSAIRYNPLIQSMHQRLIHKGKVFKVALTACMRKLLTIMNAMARDRVDWRPPIPVPA